jgi:hypothetical protein
VRQPTTRFQAFASTPRRVMSSSTAILSLCPVLCDLEFHLRKQKSEGTER